MADKRQTTYRTELDGLRAPLAVILYLIKRDNLDIYDIPIAKITKEYLEYIELMESMNIELAGEFFVMAATLMRIKAQMLLSRDEEEEDPRTELVRSLLEYKKMIEAAKSLRVLEEERSKIFTRPAREPERNLAKELELDLSLYELMKTFRELLANCPAEAIAEIEPEQFSLEEKIEAITAALARRSQVAFFDLFRPGASRLEMIVTFVALLELMRMARVKVKQEGPFGNIWLYSPGPTDREVKV